MHRQRALDAEEQPPVRVCAIDAVRRHQVEAGLLDVISQRCQFHLVAAEARRFVNDQSFETLCFPGPHEAVIGITLVESTVLAGYTSVRKYQVVRDRIAGGLRDFPASARLVFETRLALMHVVAVPHVECCPFLLHLPPLAMLVGVPLTAHSMSKSIKSDTSLASVVAMWLPFPDVSSMVLQTWRSR